jgi:chromosome segregation ATPase
MPSDFIFRKASFGGFNRDDVIAYINSMKLNEEKLTSEINEKDNLIKELNEKLADCNNKNEQIKTEYEEKISELNKCHINEIECIRNEYEEKIPNGILADRSAEERVGSAMIDVRRYADLLIQETCDKIEKMSDDADNATAKTLSRVLDISSGIQTFSDKLNSILKDILEENETICKELTGFKGTLRLPFDEASGKIQADLLGE